MSDESTTPAQAPTAAGADARKAKRDERKTEIAAKAKEAATKSGKDWDSLSKEDKQSFRKAIRTDLRAAATKRRVRRAKRADTAKKEASEA